MLNTPTTVGITLSSVGALSILAMSSVWLWKRSRSRAQSDIEMISSSQHEAQTHDLEVHAHEPLSRPASAVLRPPIRASTLRPSSRDGSRSLHLDNNVRNQGTPPPLGTRIMSWKSLHRYSPLTPLDAHFSPHTPPNTPSRSERSHSLYPSPLPPPPSALLPDPHVHRVIQYAPVSRQSSFRSTRHRSGSSSSNTNIIIPSPAPSGILHSLPPPPRSRVMKSPPRPPLLHATSSSGTLPPLRAPSVRTDIQGDRVG